MLLSKINFQFLFLVWGLPPPTFLTIVWNFFSFFIWKASLIRICSFFFLWDEITDIYICRWWHNTGLWQSCWHLHRDRDHDPDQEWARHQFGAIWGLLGVVWMIFQNKQADGVGVRTMDFLPLLFQANNIFCHPWCLSYQ